MRRRHHRDVGAGHLIDDHPLFGPLSPSPGWTLIHKGLRPATIASQQQMDRGAQPFRDAQVLMGI
jgi:hypothetical protein